MLRFKVNTVVSDFDNIGDIAALRIFSNLYIIQPNVGMEGVQVDWKSLHNAVLRRNEYFWYFDFVKWQLAKTTELVVAKPVLLALYFQQTSAVFQHSLNEKL